LLNVDSSATGEETEGDEEQGLLLRRGTSSRKREVYRLWTWKPSPQHSEPPEVFSFAYVEHLFAFHFGTDVQRCMLFWLIGGFFKLYSALWHGPALVDWIGILGYLAGLISVTLFFIGSAILVWAVYPPRMMRAMFYRGGTSISRPESEWERHFGTPLLAGSQLQMLSMTIFFVVGLLQVLFVDGPITQRHGVFAALLTSDDSIGWGNTLKGFFMTIVFWIFARTMYPEIATRPESEVAWLLNQEWAKQRLGEKRAAWLRRQVMSDNLFVGWFLSLLTLLGFIGSLTGPTRDCIASACDFIGSAFFLRFGYNDATMLDPLLFGCYSEKPEPPAHPMGPLFFSAPTDIGGGMDAALTSFDLPWTKDERSNGLSWWFTEELAGMKMEVEVDLHAFALANLFRSVEMKEEDALVERVEILEKLNCTDNIEAEVMHVFNYADPPMPRSDEVIVSALQEREGCLCVCEWAVPYSQPTAERTIRNYPFFAAKFQPLSGTGASNATTNANPPRTLVSIIAITDIATWMPPIIVRQEMEKRSEALEVLKNLPTTSDGRKLIDTVLKEVWSVIVTNVGPCTWSFILHCMPDLERLEVRRPCDVTLIWSRSEAPAFYRFGSSDTPCQPTREPLSIIQSALALAESTEWILKSTHNVKKKKFLVACCDAPRRKKDGSEDPIEIYNGPWPHSLKSRLLVRGIHPMALALALTSEEGKRFSDESIVQLDKIQELGNFNTIWYQRSQHKRPMHDREMVYQSVVQDISHNRCVVCEWPVESDSHPEGGSKLVRSRQYMLWDLTRVGPHTAVTFMCIADVGGHMSSCWMNKIVDREMRSTVKSGMRDLSTAFTDDDGVAMVQEIETQFVEEFCGEVRKELTPMQLGFMDAYSPGFSKMSGL
jgi:hypothetical protein